jgi:uncharacterized beta-barrel protein YwiB (DUF1934 family)
MKRIKIKELPKNKKISKDELSVIRGGYVSSEYLFNQDSFTYSVQDQPHFRGALQIVLNTIR